MNKQFTVDYFIAKFEAIPEDKWQEGGWGDDDKHCAGGHCGIRYNMITKTQYPPEFRSLEGLLKTLNPVQVNYCGGLSYSDYTTIIINDGMAVKYLQDSPKQRILAALYDIKKLSSGQEAQECDATKLLKEPEAGTIKYPDLTKELAVLPEDKKEVDVILVRG